MASLTIRKLDEALKKQLRLRAARHGRSVEDEVRTILRGAAAEGDAFASSTAASGASKTGAPSSHRAAAAPAVAMTVSYTHLRAHETVLDLVCRLLLEKKK